MKIALWKLLVAYFIDWVVISVVSAVVNFPVGLLLGSSGADPAFLMLLVTLFSIVSSLAIFVLYFALTEYFLQASLGKMAVKLCVADKNAQ